MNKVVFLFAFLLLIGCTATTKQVEAQFNRPQEEIIEDLKNLYDFEEVKISWTKNEIDDGSSRDIDENIKWTANQIDDGVGRNLKVYLKNGKSLPETNEEKAKIGKEAMQIILNSIDNRTDYEDFTVVFVHEAVYGGMDMTSENPFRYKLEAFK